MKGKKGQMGLGDLPGIALTIGITVIFVVVLTMILGGIQEQVLEDETGTVTSEELTLVTAGANLDYPHIATVSSATVNRSGSFVTITTANYTLDADQGRVNVTSTLNTNNSKWTYTYYTADYEYNITTQGLQAQQTWGDNFDLIVTIVVMVVILGLVVGGFYLFMRQ